MAVGAFKRETISLVKLEADGDSNLGEFLVLFDVTSGGSICCTLLSSTVLLMGTLGSGAGLISGTL